MFKKIGLFIEGLFGKVIFDDGIKFGWFLCILLGTLILGLVLGQL